MSKRLQVIMDDEEYSETQELARRHHQTTAEWVRAALREARQRASRTDRPRAVHSELVVAGPAVQIDVPGPCRHDFLDAREVVEISRAMVLRP